jgi:hypothetical protein
MKAELYNSDLGAYFPYLRKKYMKFSNILVMAMTIVMALAISACSSLPFSFNNSIEITYSSPDRISFQGKGAGAGIALMSTMGPVGIALGVAIDEGIAKDIRANAESGGIDFKRIFDLTVSQSDLLKNAERIEVKKYGFVIKNGSKDYVAAEVDLVITEGGEVHTLRLSSCGSQQELELWVTLDDIKTKPEAIEKLFSMALK